VTPASDPSPAGRAPRRRRRWSFLLTALLLGLVAALVLVEIAFRLFWTLPPEFAEFHQAGLYASTPEGGVTLTPGYRGTLQMGPGAPVTRVAVNALGMRGAEIAGKTAGERRVLVVGDSLVFGCGVDDAEALPARLQEALHGKGANCTVGNAGIPSFGPSHAVARMARLDAPFGADAFVVCTYLGNDPLDEMMPLRTVYAGQLVQGDIARMLQTSWRARLAYRSRAALWFERWILLNHPTWSPRADVPSDPEETVRMQGMPKGPATDAGLYLAVIDDTTSSSDGGRPAIPRIVEAYRVALQRAKEIANGRPVWFVILPTSWHVVESRRLEKLKEIGFDPAKYQRGLGQRRLMQVAKDLGITPLDATPILAAEADPLACYLADGSHLSVRGNERLARWLADEMEAGLR